MSTQTLSHVEEYVRESPDSYLELLLRISNKGVYDRIINCPKYPVVTGDADVDIDGFYDHLIDADSVSNILSKLYEYSEGNRKDRGQYFTPKRVSDWVFEERPFEDVNTILDPGSGTSVFASSALDYIDDVHDIRYRGVEVDPILAFASSLTLELLDAPESWKIVYGNYFELDDQGRPTLYQKLNDLSVTHVISNPPYARFNKTGDKSEIDDYLSEVIDVDMPSYAGVQSYFISYSMALLGDNTKELHFILPMEFKDTRHGRSVLSQLLDDYFIQVDGIPVKKSKSDEPTSPSLSEIFSFYPIETCSAEPAGSIDIKPPKKPAPSSPNLGDVLEVKRGISTGANSFFVISDDTVANYDIEKKYLQKIVPTQISLPRKQLTSDDWDEYREQGKDVWLLDLGSDDDFSPNIETYLEEGKARGVHKRTTCKRRTPWYNIPTQSSPQIIFTYMSRNDPEFIYNKTDCLIMTNLIGVHSDKDDLSYEQLVSVLNVELKRQVNEGKIGRNYSRGLLKIEPGEVKELPVPHEIATEFLPEKDLFEF